MIRVSWLGWFLLVLATPSRAEFRQVAVSGDPLPSLNGQSNRLQTINSVSLNRYGAIAFKGIGTEASAAVWSWTEQEGFDLVAEDGETVDGYIIDLASEFSTFEFAHTDELLLLTELHNSPVEGGRATFTWTRNDDLKTIMRPELSLPGFDEPAQTRFIVERNGLGTFFSADTPSRGEYDGYRWTSWFMDNDGDLTKLLENDAQAPGLDESLRVFFGNVESVNSSGNFVVSASVGRFSEEFGVYTERLGEGLWRGDSNGRLSVALPPRASVPAFDDDDWYFDRYDWNYINEFGDITFKGRILTRDANGREHDLFGLWRLADGDTVPELLVLDGMTPPRATEPTRFTNFKTNERNTLAILAVFDGLLWLNREESDELEPIVAKGDTVDGISEEFTISFVSRPSLNDADQIALHITLMNSDGEQLRAVVATLPGGRLAPVAKTGDRVELSPGVFGVFDEFSNVVINDQGRVVFSAVVVANGARSEGIFMSDDARLSSGDFNGDGIVGVSDVNELMKVIRQDVEILHYDLSGDLQVDATDLDAWVINARQTWYGDANLDGQFTSDDLIQIFQGGQYEDGVVRNSTWATGDWNSDAEFTSADLVLAFQDGGYEQGARGAGAAVPEPSASALLVLAATFTVPLTRRKRF